MKNIGDFIRANFNIFTESIIAVVLLGLEKLMETDFNCPKNEVLGIFYGLAFLCIPTTIIIILPYPFLCTKTCSKLCKDNAITSEKSDRRAINSKKCCNLKDNIIKPVLQLVRNVIHDFKAALFWVFILITDGRYVDCVVKSITKFEKISMPSNLISQANGTTVQDDFTKEKIQIGGLFGVLLLVIILVCKCETKSKRNQKKHRNFLLKDTENAVRSEALRKQEEFIQKMVSQIDWKEYNVLSLDPSEQLDELIISCQHSVTMQLKDSPEDNCEEQQLCDQMEEVEMDLKGQREK